MKIGVAFLLATVTTVALTVDAGAQSREACRRECGYIEPAPGANEGKAGQTPAVNACYRKCMGRAGTKTGAKTGTKK